MIRSYLYDPHLRRFVFAARRERQRRAPSFFRVPGFGSDAEFRPGVAPFCEMTRPKHSRSEADNTRKLTARCRLRGSCPASTLVARHSPSARTTFFVFSLDSDFKKCLLTFFKTEVLHATSRPAHSASRRTSIRFGRPLLYATIPTAVLSGIWGLRSPS